MALDFLTDNKHYTIEVVMLHPCLTPTPHTYKQSILEDVVVEGPTEQHQVLHLNAEQVLDGCEARVLRKARGAEVRDGHRGEQNEHHVEQERIHPRAIEGHGVQREHVGYANATLQVALRDAPQQVQREEAIKEHSNEVDVLLIQTDEHAIQEGVVRKTIHPDHHVQQSNQYYHHITHTSEPTTLSSRPSVSRPETTATSTPKDLMIQSKVPS